MIAIALGKAECQASQGDRERGQAEPRSVLELLGPPPDAPRDFRIVSRALSGRKGRAEPAPHGSNPVGVPRCARYALPNRMTEHLTRERGRHGKSV